MTTIHNPPTPCTPVARKMLSLCVAGVYTNEPNMDGARMVSPTGTGAGVSVTDWLRSLFPTFRKPSPSQLIGNDKMGTMSSSSAHGTSLTLSDSHRSMLASKLRLDGALYAGVRDASYSYKGGAVGARVVIQAGQPCPCGTESSVVTACWAMDGLWCIPQGTAEERPAPQHVPGVSTPAAFVSQQVQAQTQTQTQTQAQTQTHAEAQAQQQLE